MLICHPVERCLIVFRPFAKRFFHLNDKQQLLIQDVLLGLVLHIRLVAQECTQVVIYRQQALGPIANYLGQYYPASVVVAQ